MTFEIGRIFSWPLLLNIVIIIVLTAGYGFYVSAAGRWLFIFLVLIMIPLATTELGTDSWLTELVTPVMGSMGLQPGWVLVYTAFIMMVLRFLAGPIIERLKPPGLLAVSSAIAIIGRLFFSKAAGILIFIAATIYALGKTFFWPTMLGVVSERFPKGGALTINTISGVGMLCVGVIGAAFLGIIQDKQIDRDLYKEKPALHAQVIGEKTSLFGKYNVIDKEKKEAMMADAKKVIDDISNSAKKNALMTVAIFPTIMLICYLILIFYFRKKGGYRAVELQVQED